MLLAYINLLHCYKRKEARLDNECVLVSSVAPYSWWYLVFVGGCDPGIQLKDPTAQQQRPNSRRHHILVKHILTTCSTYAHPGLGIKSWHQSIMNETLLLLNVRQEALCKNTHQPYDRPASNSDVSKGFIMAFLHLLCLCNSTKKKASFVFLPPSFKRPRALHENSPYYGRTAC